jgi:hypothetical protein
VEGVEREVGGARAERPREGEEEGRVREPGGRRGAGKSDVLEAAQRERCGQPDRGARRERVRLEGKRNALKNEKVCGERRSSSPRARPRCSRCSARTP